MNKCYCGNNKSFKECCEPFIKKQKHPATVEELMRSRYSAYVTKDIDYIESTHTVEERDKLSIEETRKWAEDSIWLGLEILKVEKGQPSDDSGKVEFIAKFSQNNLVYEHHELSRFEKRDNQWFYLDGKVSQQTSAVTKEKEVGRNDPCPCGSGKKYKKCCKR